MGYDSYLVYIEGLTFDIRNTYLPAHILKKLHFERKYLDEETPVSGLFNYWSGQDLPEEGKSNFPDRTLIYGYLTDNEVRSWQTVCTELFFLNKKKSFWFYLVTEEALLYRIGVSYVVDWKNSENPRVPKFSIQTNSAGLYLCGKMQEYSDFTYDNGVLKLCKIYPEKVEAKDPDEGSELLVRTIDYNDSPKSEFVCDLRDLRKILMDFDKSQILSWNFENQLPLSS